MKFETLYRLTEERKQEEFHRHLAESKTQLSAYEEVLLKSNLHLKLSEFQEVQDLINPFLDQKPNIKLMETISLKVKLLGSTLFQGNRDTVRKLIEQISELYETRSEIDLPEIHTYPIDFIIYGDFLSYSGLFYFTTGNYQESQNILSRAVTLEEQLQDPLRIAKALINLSIIEYYRGNFTEALKHQYQAKEINDQLQILDLTAQNYGNISITYVLKGEYESALYYIEKTIEIFEERGSLEELAGAYSTHANIYFRIGDYERANKKYNQSLQIRRENEGKLNSGNYSQTLLDFTIFSINQNHDIGDLISEFKRLVNRNKGNMYIELRYKLINAISHFNSKSMREIIRSEDTFKEIIDQPSADYLLIYLSTLYLIDLQLLEYRSLRHAEQLNEIKKHLDNIKNWADEKEAKNIEVIYLLLKFQLGVYQEDISLALDSISRALNLTYNKGLHRFYQLTHFLYDQFRSRYDKSNRKVTIDTAEIDLVKTIHNFDYSLEFEIDTVIEIQCIFSITPQHDIIHLYGNIFYEIGDIISISDHIDSTDQIYIEIIDNGTLILNMREFPWIGVIANSVHEELVTQLFAIQDYITVYSTSRNIPDPIQILRSSELNKFIKEILEDEFVEDEAEEDTIHFDSVKELQKFRIFLHPVRLSIMNNISRYFSIPRARLEKMVGGRRTNFTSNLTKLLDENILGSEIQFIDDKPRTVIYIHQAGLNLYNQFKEKVSELK